MPLSFVILAIAAPALQDGFPPGRFGAYVETIDGLRGPVDAVALEDGALLVVERDADRLTRIGPDGARGAFGPADLDAPEDVAALPGGGFAVADTGGERVVILDAAGALVRELGSLRSPTGVAASAAELYVALPRAGEVHVFERERWTRARVLAGLERPVAVELAPDGEVVVLDAGTHRVEVYGPDGAHRRGWGDFGPHAGFLGHPRGLAVADGRILVADADNHRIQAFDLSGAYVYEWGKHAFRPREGEGSLHYPSGVTVVGRGVDARVLVSEAFGDRMQVFERTTADPARFMTDPGVMPWKVSPHYGGLIATAGDVLAVFEPETQTVLVHDLELDVPVEVARFGAYGDAPGQHREIVDVLVDADPWTVTVADPLAGVLSTWSLDHEPDAPLKMNPRMASFARSTRLWPVPFRPGALERAWSGALAAVDLDRGSVRVWSNGAEVFAAGGFDDPVDLAFDGRLLWVVDRGARRVVGLDAEGRERHVLDGLRRPRGVAAAPDGEVYVTDEVAHEVRVFGPDAADSAYVPLRAFGREGLGPGELYRPAGVVVDARDRVIVLDHGNHRGMIFDRAGGFLTAFGPRGYVRPTLR